MRIALNREYTVNMANYESMKFGASIEGEYDDTEAALQSLRDRLTNILKEDVALASGLTDKTDSFIHTIEENNNATRHTTSES